MVRNTQADGRPRERASACLPAEESADQQTATGTTCRHLAYWPSRSGSRDGVPCREFVIRTRCIPRNLTLVHAQVVGDDIHNLTLEKHRLWVTQTSRTIHNTPGACCCRCQRASRCATREIITARRRSPVREQPNFQLAQLGIGKAPWSESRCIRTASAVTAQRHLADQVDVAGEAGGDEVARLVLDPLHRPLKQDRGQDRRRLRGRPGPCCRSRRRCPGR